MATSKDVLKLYRQLLQTSNKFDNYNFREWAKRKVVHDFKSHKDLSKDDEIVKFYNEGITGLNQLKRQTAISQMYTFEKLVVEPLKHHHK